MTINIKSIHDFYTELEEELKDGFIKIEWRQSRESVKSKKRLEIEKGLLELYKSKDLSKEVEIKYEKLENADYIFMVNYLSPDQKVSGRNLSEILKDKFKNIAVYSDEDIILNEDEVVYTFKDIFHYFPNENTSEKIVCKNWGKVLLELKSELEETDAFNVFTLRSLDYRGVNANQDYLENMPYGLFKEWDEYCRQKNEP